MLNTFRRRRKSSTLFFRTRPAITVGWIVKGMHNEDVVTLITPKGTILEMVMHTEYDWEPSA